MADQGRSRDASRDASSVLLRARARVLHDLSADQVDLPAVVDILDGVLQERDWWLSQWAEGAEFVDGLVAQDVQDRLIDRLGRWPTCRVHHGEPLSIEPELGPHPTWVCVHGCGDIAALGHLPAR